MTEAAALALAVMRARDNGGTPTRDDVQRLRAEASPSTAMEALEDAEEEENDEHDEEESAEEEENDGESDEEDEDDDRDEDDGVLSKQDRDMHRSKQLPCVPIGETFDLEGTSFKRVGYKSAECMRCDHKFPPKAYGKQMAMHAAACRRKAGEKEAKEKARADATSARASAPPPQRTPQEKWPGWEGKKNTVTHTVDGVDVTVTFENVFIGASSIARGHSSSDTHSIQPH